MAGLVPPGGSGESLPQAIPELQVFAGNLGVPWLVEAPLDLCHQPPVVSHCVLCPNVPLS